MQNLPIKLYRAAQVRELDRIAIQERGIPVTRAVIQKNDGATVSAQITFAGGAPP